MGPLDKIADDFWRSPQDLTNCDLAETENQIIPARPQPFKKILQQPLDISWAAFEEHVNNL